MAVKSGTKSEGEDFTSQFLASTRDLITTWDNICIKYVRKFKVEEAISKRWFKCREPDNSSDRENVTSDSFTSGHEEHLEPETKQKCEMIRNRFNRYLECQDLSDISSGDDCNQGLLTEVDSDFYQANYGLLTEVDSDFYQANYEGSKVKPILRKRQPCISLLSDEDEIVSDVTTTRKPPKMRKKKKSKRLVTQVDGSSGDDEDEDYKSVNQQPQQVDHPALSTFGLCSCSDVDSEEESCPATQNQSQNQIFFPSLPLYMNCSSSQVYPTPQLFCPDHCDFNTFILQPMMGPQFCTCDEPIL